MRSIKPPCHCGKPSRAQRLCSRHLREHRAALPVFEVVNPERLRLERERQLRESNARFLAFLDRVYAEE